MRRWSVPAALGSLLWLAPQLSHAQVGPKLKVLAPGAFTVDAKNSSTYIEVTATNNGTPVCTYRCEPNLNACSSSACSGVEYNGLASRLVYDNSREKLVACNGEAVTVDGAECSLADGVLSATTHVRLGELKIIPKAAPGYEGLKLNTTGAGVRLQFKESPDDYWDVGYYTGLGVNPQFTARAAGVYQVIASDLTAHCLPTQYDPGLELTIPEAGEVELTLLFRGTECELTVERTLSEGSPGGSVESTPAGLQCGVEPDSPCTGRFAFGTELTLTPVPAGNVRYSFLVGDGCVPGNEPCDHTLESDRAFHVNFSADPLPDAGAEPADGGSTDGSDAGSDPSDGDGEPDNGDGEPGNLDAGAQDGDDGDGASADGDDSDGDDAGADQGGGSGGSGGCAVQSSQTSSAEALMVLLAGLLWVRRRRTNTRRTQAPCLREHRARGEERAARL